MTAIGCVGIAVHDFVFTVDTMPHHPGKHYATGFTEVGGGIAANAAVAAARLGATASLVSRVGTDAVGERVVADLKRERVDVTGVRSVPGAHTPVSAVLVDAAGERLIVNHTTDTLFTHPLDPGEAEVRGADVLLVDTRWPAGALRALTTHRGPAVVDYDHDLPGARDLADSATHVIFGRAALTGYAGTGDAEAGIRRAAKSTGAWCAVTLGHDGVIWTDGSRLGSAPAFAVTAIDTLGAGDIFHGAFAVGIAEGMVEADAVRFASAAAAIKCTRPGGREGAPHRNDVDRFLEEHT